MQKLSLSFACFSLTLSFFAKVVEEVYGPSNNHVLLVLHFPILVTLSQRKKKHMVNELEGFLKMNGSEEKLKKIYINLKKKCMKAKKYSKYVNFIQSSLLLWLTSFHSYFCYECACTLTINSKCVIIIRKED